MCTGLLQSQYTYIPDNNFEQALIDLGIDSDGVLNNQVLTSDIEDVEVLNISSLYIEDLTGIQDFLSLTALNCSDNNLVNLDLSNNLQLTTLMCSNNESLTNIDISNLVNLNYLNIMRCLNLPDLDLSDNTNLEYLLLGEGYCSQNVINYQLTSLDLSNNSSLKYLVCQGVVSLENVNLNNCESLETLIFRCNGFDMDLDLTDCINLKELNCSTAHLTNLNLQNNIALETLICGDISDYGWEYNNFQNLDLSNNVNLKVLKCQNIFFNSNIPFYGLDLSNNHQLIYADLDFNFLDELDISNGNNYNLSLRLPTILPLYDRLQCVTVDNEDIATIANADENDWVESDMVIYSVNCENTDIPNENLMKNISIFPNPFSDVINVESRTHTPIERIKIYNYLGIKIIETDKTRINASQIDEGVYFIAIELASRTLIRKIVKI